MENKLLFILDPLAFAKIKREVKKLKSFPTKREFKEEWMGNWAQTQEDMWLRRRYIEEREREQENRQFQERLQYELYNDRRGIGFVGNSFSRTT